MTKMFFHLGKGNREAGKTKFKAMSRKEKKTFLKYWKKLLILASIYVRSNA